MNARTKRGRLERELELEIKRTYYALAEGVQVDILDIPRIFADAKIEHSAGVPLEKSMPGIIARYAFKGESRG